MPAGSFNSSVQICRLSRHVPRVTDSRDPRYEISEASTNFNDAPEESLRDIHVLEPMTDLFSFRRFISCYCVFFFMGVQASMCSFAAAPVIHFRRAYPEPFRRAVVITETWFKWMNQLDIRLLVQESMEQRKEDTGSREICTIWNVTRRGSRSLSECAGHD